jgi:hypothetical protein
VKSKDSSVTLLHFIVRAYMKVWRYSCFSSVQFYVIYLFIYLCIILHIYLQTCPSKLFLMNWVWHYVCKTMLLFSVWFSLVINNSNKINLNCTW